MNDWRSWLSSSETRVKLSSLDELREEIRTAITDGFTQEKSIEKISLDYTYALGQLEGIQMAIETLKDIVEENNDK